MKIQQNQLSCKFDKLFFQFDRQNAVNLIYKISAYYSYCKDRLYYSFIIICEWMMYHCL
jgi:hypothetical protein